MGACGSKFLSKKKLKSKRISKRRVSFNKLDKIDECGKRDARCHSNSSTLLGSNLNWVFILFYFVISF